MGTPREDLASKLRESRIAAGYGTQSALAKRLNVSRPVISKAENPAQALPSKELLTAWAGITGVPLDELDELAERTRSGFPEWFMLYQLAEAKAHTLRCWAPLVVPGLLQTEAYARAMLAVEPYTPTQLDELVAARMERQRLIGKAYMTAIIDQQVLHRCIGSAKIMTEQCTHLTVMANRPDIALHVIPEGANVGLWGAFDLASQDGATTLCLTALEDVPTEARKLIVKAMQAFERILGAALPRAESLSLIQSVEEQWKTQI
jgi:transcriptional regulator with XRE-family HTH domain